MADINRYITAKDVVVRALKILGLPAPVSPASATESNAKQMWALLTEVGQEILGEYEWQIRTKTFEVVVQDPVLEYDFPADLEEFIGSTGWNLTTRLPIIGPVDSQIWAALKARNLGGTTTSLQYIVERDKLVFYFAPSDPQTVRIEYKSRGWARDGSDPLVFRDFVEADADMVMFDPQMVVKKLILEWRKKKGFATPDDEKDYDRALNAAKYKDRPRLDLRTSGCPTGYPLLGIANLPDQAYGT